MTRQRGAGCQVQGSSTAAQDITADNFTLDDLTDKDNTARRRQLLEGLGRHYAARQGMDRPRVR